MELTRRDFVRICTGTVAGIGVSGMFHPFVRDVLAETLTGQRPPVFWVEGQGCTGCTVSLLNNAHPGIAKVLLEIIAMHFHPTIMAAEGQLAFQSMLDKSKEFNSQYVLIVEGSIPLKATGNTASWGKWIIMSTPWLKPRTFWPGARRPSLPPGHVRPMAAFQRRAGSRRKR